MSIFKKVEDIVFYSNNDRINIEAGLDELVTYKELDWFKLEMFEELGKGIVEVHILFQEPGKSGPWVLSGVYDTKT
jgi:hypothetical protein